MKTLLILAVCLVGCAAPKLPKAIADTKPKKIFSHEEYDVYYFRHNGHDVYFTKPINTVSQDN